MISLTGTHFYNGTNAERVALTPTTINAWFYETDTALMYWWGNGAWSATGGMIVGAGVSGQVTYWTGANSIAGDPGFIYDAANNRVGIGVVTAPGYELDIAANAQSQISVTTASSVSAITRPIFSGRRARNTYTVPNIILQDDYLLSILAWGYDGAAYLPAASVEFLVDGAPGANDMPGRIIFCTTPDGAAARVERLRISQNGDVVINDTGLNTGALRVETDTEANMILTDAANDLMKFGGTANATEILKGGDVLFIGAGAGLAFGGAYGNEIAWSRAAAVQNTWYNISDADMTDMQLNNVTHDGSGKLTATYAGIYLIVFAVSMECSALNKHIQTCVYVSGVAQNPGIIHWDTSTAAQQFVMTSTTLLSLGAGATIEIAVRTTDAGTPDLTVDHLNFTIVQVGS